MSISDQPFQKSSMSNQQSPVDSQAGAEEPMWAIPSRSMPAKTYLVSAKSVGVMTPPEVAVPADFSASDLDTLPQMALRPVRPLQFKKPENLRLGLPIAAVLLLLTLVIIVGNIFGPRLWGGGHSTATNIVTGKGPFVQLPLSPAQINSIKHLVSYMQYKQLASLYVSRMNLDQELGQLIMVEYAETSYSPQLDMMVNQLHAGGVIMYEFQMNT